ncbi:hypothetical protein HYPSUDRAFT_59613, partial [Hypholoma sublateritium FD-334 SS-4]
MRQGLKKYYEEKIPDLIRRKKDIGASAVIANWENARLYESSSKQIQRMDLDFEISAWSANTIADLDWMHSLLNSMVIFEKDKREFGLYSEPSTDEPQRPPNQDYMLTVNDYRSRIRNHHDVIQLCNLAKRQHSVDRINWINSLEVQVDKLRQEIEQKENEIFQRFAELNSASLVLPSRIIPRAPVIILSQYIRMSEVESPLRFQNDDRRNPDVKCPNVHIALLNPVLILVTHQPVIPVASVSPQLIGSLIAPTIAAVAVGGDCPVTDLQENDWNSNEGDYLDDLPDEAVSNMIGEPYHPL